MSGAYQTASMESPLNNSLLIQKRPPLAPTSRRSQSQEKSQKLQNSNDSDRMRKQSEKKLKQLTAYTKSASFASSRGITLRENEQRKSSKKLPKVIFKEHNPWDIGERNKLDFELELLANSNFFYQKTKEAMQKLNQKEEKARHSGPFNRDKLQELQDIIDQSGNAEQAFDDWDLEKLREQTQFPEQDEKTPYQPILPPISEGVIDSTRRSTKRADGSSRRPEGRQNDIEPKLMAQREALIRGDVALYDAIEKLNAAAAKEVAMRLQIDEDIQKEAEEMFKYDSDLDNPEYDEFWEDLGTETIKKPKPEESLEVVLKSPVSQTEFNKEKSGEGEGKPVLMEGGQRNFALQRERKEYRKHMASMRKAHAEEMKNVKLTAKKRLEDILKRKVESLKNMFMDEVANMLKQFYALKDENTQQRKRMNELKEITSLQQRHNSELRSVWQQVTLKDKEDEQTIQRLKEYKLYDPALRQFEFRVERNPHARVENYLDNPLHFYDSYLNLSSSLKDKIAERDLVKFYKEQMMKMQDQIEQLESQLETTNTLVFLHNEHEINSEENVSIYRKRMEDAERQKRAEIERMEQRMEDQTIDFMTEKKEMNQRFQKYREISCREIEVNEQIRARQQEDIDKLQEELKELRNIIRQPRLHYKLMESLGYEQLLNAYDEREKQSSEKKKQTHTNIVNINFGEQVEPMRRQKRKLDSALTNVSHSIAPSLSAFSDMPSTKRALYSLRQAKKLGSATPSISTFSRSTAIGTNVNASSRAADQRSFFDFGGPGSVNRSISGFGDDSVSATGVPPRSQQRRTGGSQYSALNLKQRFQHRGQRIGGHSRSMIDQDQLKSFGAQHSSFTTGGRVSGLGDHSLESENVLMGYQQIAERIDEANTTLGGSAGFAK